MMTVRAGPGLLVVAWWVAAAGQELARVAMGGGTASARAAVRLAQCSSKLLLTVAWTREMAQRREGRRGSQRLGKRRGREKR